MFISIIKCFSTGKIKNRSCLLLLLQGLLNFAQCAFSIACFFNDSPWISPNNSLAKNETIFSMVADFSTFVRSLHFTTHHLGDHSRWCT